MNGTRLCSGLSQECKGECIAVRLVLHSLSPEYIRVPPHRASKKETQARRCHSSLTNKQSAPCQGEAVARISSACQPRIRRIPCPPLTHREIGRFTYLE